MNYDSKRRETSDYGSRACKPCKRKESHATKVMQRKEIRKSLARVSVLVATRLREFRLTLTADLD